MIWTLVAQVEFLKGKLGSEALGKRGLWNREAPRHA